MGAPKPIIDPHDHEIAYLRLIRAHGHPGPAAKRVDLQPPVADDGETDCWTHAWDVARRVGAAYVEGTCVRPGAGGPSMHAWVEEKTPFGPRIVECTPGYEEATNYVGVRVDNTRGGNVDRATKGFGRPRSSVLQASLASGFSIDEALAQTRPTPATPRPAKRRRR